MTHAADCYPGDTVKCFGLACQCGYAACIKASFDHKCPLSGVNAAWAMFMAIASFAFMVGLVTR